MKKFRFEGSFNSFGFVEIESETEDEAWSIFCGIDHGIGYGIADEREVESTVEI